MVVPVLSDVLSRCSTPPASTASIPLAQQAVSCRRRLPCCVSVPACLGDAYGSLKANGRIRENRRLCSTSQAKATAERRRGFPVVSAVESSAAAAAATTNATVGDLVAEIEQLEKEMRNTFERVAVSRARVARLRDAVERLEAAGTSALRKGDSVTGQRVAREQQRVLVGLSKAEGRAAVLEQLAGKLAQAIASRERRILQAPKEPQGSPRRATAPASAAMASPATATRDPPLSSGPSEVRLGQQQGGVPEGRRPASSAPSEGGTGRRAANAAGRPVEGRGGRARRQVLEMYARDVGELAEEVERKLRLLELLREDERRREGRGTAASNQEGCDQRDGGGEGGRRFEDVREGGGKDSTGIGETPEGYSDGEMDKRRWNDEMGRKEKDQCREGQGRGPSAIQQKMQRAEAVLRQLHRLRWSIQEQLQACS